jgi:hypothetical protein
MRIAAIIARLLLGLMFTVFGLNGFLLFIPTGPMPTGPAGQFMAATVPTHYMAFVFAVQLGCGVLLLVNRFVPLALTFLAPVLVNILLYHITMAPNGLPPGLLATVLWLVLAFHHRAAFAGIVRARAVTP